MPARLVVSVHDVAPGSAAQSKQWFAELDARGIPASMLVIPGPWRGGDLRTDDGFAQLLALRAAAGDEIVQHGWLHCAGADRHGWRSVTERVLARGSGEFAAIAEPAALARLRAGRSALAGVGLGTAGFTAPGWLHSPDTMRALLRLGFRYTTTHTGVLDLATGRRHRAVVFSHRPGGLTARVAARAMVTGSRIVAGQAGLVRIALHPDDLAHPRLRDATLQAIDRCMADGAHAMTYRTLLGPFVEAV